jgi:hypothetical protein
MLSGWKLLTDFGSKSLRCHSIDPRDRVPPSNRLRQLRSWLRDLLQTFVEQRNFVFHKLYRIDPTTKQEAMMGTDLSFESNS